MVRERSGSSRRTERVGDLVRNVLSELILRGIKDPRVAGALVTVTGVDVSPDLRHAQVFVSSPDDRVEAAIAGLESAAGWLRRELGRRIQTKYTPELHFSRDASIAEGARIERMLSELEGDPPVDPGLDEEPA